MSELASSDNRQENAIDIFVFSNGEQNAPPRKYHLELKEINMWKGTLRNLGNSHYGIENTDIDIYTTDGRKVEGPSELSHLKAYVAVIPPCAFIQAGYDNYLIKATRSWEKRLLKITNSMESSTKDQKQTVLPKSDLIIKIIENETQNQNGKEDDIRDKTSNSTKANMLKSNSTKSKKFQECSKIVKCQIKKPLFTTETSTLKTQIFTPFKISSVAKRSAIKTKESLQTKSFAPKKVIPINVKRNTARVPCTDNNCDKLGEKNIIPSIITSLNVLAKKSENIFPPMSPITPQNSKQTQDFETKTPISKEETNIYKNTATEIKSITELNCDEILNETFKNTIDNEVLISDKLGLDASTVHLQRKSSKLSLSHNENRKQIHCIEPQCPAKKEADETYDPSLSCQNCVLNQGPIDNFVAIINNDKIFKLQFNLEIDNGKVLVKNDNEMKKTHSIKNILREEKEIQVNMYEESNTVREHIHTHFPKSDIIKKLSDEGKIIIIHCSCFNDIDLDYLLQSNISHNQICQYEIAPELRPGIEKEKMRCDSETKQPNEWTLRNLLKENIPGNEFSEAHNVTKVSENKLITLEAEFVQCNSTVDNETLVIPSRANGLISSAKAVLKMRSSEMTTRPIPEDNKLDLFISRHTQTNWCSIILQAVRHEGGRYSLRLPSLHTIKNMAECCESQ